METEETDWNKHWGANYDLCLKRRFHHPQLLRLARNGQIGPTILDLGSGQRGLGIRVSEDLVSSDNRPYKVFSFDIAAKPSHEFIYKPPHTFTLERCAQDTVVPEAARLLAEVHYITGRIEEIGHKRELPSDVDTIILSDILNYLDVGEVLPSLLPRLKEGGRMILFNKPNIGFASKFHPNRPKSNEELQELVAKMPDLEVESVTKSTRADETGFIDIIRDVVSRTSSICETFLMFGDALLKQTQVVPQQEPHIMIVLVKRSRS